MVSPEIKLDLSYGEDVRGDWALFIESSHIENGKLDEEAKAFTAELGPTFSGYLKTGNNKEATVG